MIRNINEKVYKFRNSVQEGLAIGLYTWEPSDKITNALENYLIKEGGKLISDPLDEENLVYYNYTSDWVVIINFNDSYVRLAVNACDSNRQSNFILKDLENILTDEN
jgi:hypothetical protein